MVIEKKLILSKPFKWKKARNCPGFTLLELLISILIVSMILSIMFGAVRLGIRAWEKGEEDTDQMHRLRMAKSLIKRQISSMNTKNVLNSDVSPKPIAFILKGTDTSIEFISNYSILPDSRMTPVYVKYYLTNRDTAKDLVMFEKKISTLNFQELLELQKTEDNAHVLLKDIYNFRFEYLKRNIDGTSDWQDSWNMGFKQTVEFPVAVKIDFLLNASLVSFVVKIMSEYEGGLKQ